MALRKASAYSKKIARPFTRKSRSKGKAYIKVVPFSKITKMTMGNQADYNGGKYPFLVKLTPATKVQVRDNALEACRMLVVKIMDTEAPGQYYFAVKVFPHHMLRENKTAAGAGADRLSSGMKHSYGIVIGRAAIVKPGKSILEVYCADEKVAAIARKALNTAKPKVPGSTKVLFERTK